MVIWIGADWDSQKCVVVYESAGKLRNGKVARNPAAVRKFVLGQAGQVVVGIESGDRLWQVLWRRAGAEVHVFDGKKARHFSQSLCSSGARDDKRSATDLLSMVQSQAHRAVANDELPVALRGAKRILQTCDEASQEVVRCESRLASHLRQVHPAFHALVSSLQSKWVLRSLQAGPTPQAWSELSEDTQDDALKGTARKQRGDFTQALADDWGAIETEEEPGVRLRIRFLVQALQDAIARHKAASKALVQATEQNSAAQAAREFDGIGPHLSASIAIAIGDPSGRHRQRDRLAVQLGSAPVTDRSGERGDAKPRVTMRRSAAKSLRKSGHLIGFQLSGRYRWAQAQYRYHVDRGRSSAAAYRRVVRSFSRILNALIRDDAVFDEDLYINVLKAKGIPWAAAL